MIDPVRYLSNVSTGVMGYELARASHGAGYPTVLISGPTALKPPRGVRFIPIMSSHELEHALKKYFPKCDVLFMTSAVCDFRPVKFSKGKIKRRDFFNLKLEKTTDILKEIAQQKGKRVVVGFCLETDNLLANARQKLSDKKIDYIVANFLGRGSMPFGDHRTSVTLLGKDGQTLSLKNASKSKVAKFLFETVVAR